IARQNLGIAYAKLKIAQDKAASQGKLSANLQKELINIAGVESNVNILQNQLDELPSATGAGARIRGFFTSNEARVGLNDKVTAYESFRKAIIGPIARSISSEVGVLTDQDIKRAEEILPKISDTEGERKMKIELLQEMINNRKSIIGLMSQGLGQSLLLAEEPTEVDLSEFDFQLEE
ncbi:MAG: hypothetical protein AABY22_19545, partial [Nanoarchaeota archaeon]